MGPEKSEERGRVKIVFLIGKTVMVAMMSGPPEDTFLRRGHGHEGDDELKGAACFEGAVRKIAMVAGGDPEHASGEKRYARDEIGPVKRKEKNAKRKKMNDGERKREKNRNAGAIRQGYGPIARERSHPARSSVISGTARTQPERDARELNSV